MKTYGPVSQDAWKRIQFPNGSAAQRLSSTKSGHLTADRACSYREILVDFVCLIYWKLSGIQTAVGDLKRWALLHASRLTQSKEVDITPHEP